MNVFPFVRSNISHRLGVFLSQIKKSDKKWFGLFIILGKLVTIGPVPVGDNDAIL